jgi:hypothetical protein
MIRKMIYNKINKTNGIKNYKINYKWSIEEKAKIFYWGINFKKWI